MKQLGQVMTVFTTIGLSFCVNRAESVTVQDFDAPGTPFTSVQKERPPPPTIMSGGPRGLISDPSDSTNQVGISSASGFRFHAGPAADCRSFLLTNAGGYYQMGGTNDDTGSRLRGIVDWGMMVNVSQRNALGLSWFVTLNDDELTTGPVARYRRWFGHANKLSPPRDPLSCHL